MYYTRVCVNVLSMRVVFNLSKGHSESIFDNTRCLVVWCRRTNYISRGKLSEKVYEIPVLIIGSVWDF